MSRPERVRLCGILVHWHDPAGAANVVQAWPKDSRFELLVIDNDGERELMLEGARIIRPAANLGFAGAVNLGVHNTEAPIVLILNTDVLPLRGALEAILRGFDQYPDAAGLAPSIAGTDGGSQYRWQLRPLPNSWQLLCQGLMLPVWSGPATEPDSATVIEQPAAAALAIKRSVLHEVGGLDEAFYPAWFEDVDLAARLKAHGKIIRYWPAARFVHELGSSVRTLGYTSFLWIHYRNLWRYLRKHHGRFWGELTRLLMVPASLLRIVILPLRGLRRVESRRQAAVALWTLALGAASRWSRPETLRRRFSRDPTPGVSS